MTRVKKRADCFGNPLAALFDQQHAPFLFAVPRIHRVKQARAFNEPWLVVPIDIQHEDEVFVFEIPADRRMMAGSGAEDGLATEVDDVTAGGIVGLLEMLSKFLCIQIPKYGHGA